MAAPRYLCVSIVSAALIKNPKATRKSTMSLHRSIRACALQTAIAFGIAATFTQQVQAAPGDLIGTPIRISITNPDSHFFWGPQIGSDAAGNLVTVWLDTRGALMAQRYAPDGSALTAAFEVAAPESGATGALTNPTVAVNAGGQFVVLWADVTNTVFDQFGKFLEYTNYPTMLHARTFASDGTPIGADSALANLTRNSQKYEMPAVAIDDSGSFVVSWVDTSTSVQLIVFTYGEWKEQSAVYARKFDVNGKPQSDTIELDNGSLLQKGIVPTFFGHEDVSTAVGMDGAGNFNVLWETGDFTARGSTVNVQGQSFDANGKALGASYAVSTTDTEYATNLSEAMNRKGQFVVAWTGCYSRATLSRYQVCARRFDSGGTPTTAEIAVNNDLDFTGDAYPDYPSAAIDQSGRFIVTTQGTGSSANIMTERYFAADGSTLSASTTVPLNDLVYGGFTPSGVAMDAAGNAMLTYFGNNLKNGGSVVPIYLQRVTGN
jgi:hypothetical protein